MQYLLLIYGNEKDWESLSDKDREGIYARYGSLIEETTKSGHFRGTNELQHTKTASTVRVRNGKTVITDGPFAETKEQLGGYFLIEAENLEEARSIAARIPDVETGSIEVRPVVIRG